MNKSFRKSHVETKRTPNLTGTVKKLHTRLCRQVGQAVADFNIIEEGDKVMVCLSGGKDSFGLLDILLSMQSRAPVEYDWLR